ncbi:MAG: hypothetical protein JNG41_01990 [Dialister sp.]|nr:hypothetical protein [Dialister sp.]
MKKELTLDRIEEKVAIFLTEEEEEIHLPAAWFEDLHEGMAIDMSLVENEDREAASLQEAEDLLAEIKRMNGE